MTLFGSASVFQQDDWKFYDKSILDHNLTNFLGVVVILTNSLPKQPKKPIFYQKSWFIFSKKAEKIKIQGKKSLTQD